MAKDQDLATEVLEVLEAQVVENQIALDEGNAEQRGDMFAAGAVSEWQKFSGSVSLRER